MELNASMQRTRESLGARAVAALCRVVGYTQLFEGVGATPVLSFRRWCTGLCHETASGTQAGVEVQEMH